MIGRRVTSTSDPFTTTYGQAVVLRVVWEGKFGISAIVGNSVDEHSFGIASSAVQMASSVGAVAGISVLTAVTAGATSTEGFYEGYVYGAGIAAVGFAASFFIEGRRREAS